jgi:hypothetical protein
MVSLIENLISRKCDMDGEGNLIGATLHYLLTGVSSDSTARTLIRNSLSDTFNDLVLDGIALEPEWVDTDTTRGHWRVEANYVPREESEPKTTEIDINIEVGAASQLITQALEHTDS